MTSSAAGAVGERLAGHGASRPKALFVSVAAGAVVTVVAYRWLRSGTD